MSTPVMERDHLISGTPSTGRSFGLILGLTMMVGFLLRIAVRAQSGPADFFVNGYGFFAGQAKQIASGHGYVNPMGWPVTERPPLYAMYVAALHGYDQFWPILVVQSLVSTGTIACAAGISWLFFGRRAALIAAAITALYPYYIVHDTALQETGLFGFLTALSTLLLLLLRRSLGLVLAVGAGVVLGLATLTRPTLVPMVPLIALWLVFGGRTDTPLVRRARTAMAVFLTACAMLTPWLLREHALIGAWTMTSDGGRAVFVGNNPHTFDVYPTGSIDRSQERSFRALPPQISHANLGADPIARYAYNQQLLQIGLDYIRSHPAHFLLSAVRKNLAGFGIMPSPRGSIIRDLAHALSYGPLLVLALVGLWWTRRDRRGHALIYMHFLSFAGQTALLWAHTSHRAYLDVYLIVYASLPLATLSSAFRPMTHALGRMHEPQIARPPAFPISEV